MTSENELSATTLDDLLPEASNQLGHDERGRFRIICLSTNLSWEELLQRVRGYFTETTQGAFHQLHTTYEKHNKEFDVYLYLYQHSDTGAPIIFTLNSYDDFRRTSKRMIDQTEDLYTLWIRPGEMAGLREEVLDHEGIRLTGFDYDTFGKDEYKGERRPGYQRSGSNDSEDAEHILEEWKLEYGISPTQLRFELPARGEFHFSNDGEFVLSEGDTRFFYDEVVEAAIRRAYPLSETVQSSELTVRTENGIDQIEEQPLEMDITDTLDYDDIDTFVSDMKQDGFYPYSYQEAPGSLLLSGRIMDEQNGGMISVATDGETMTILPRYESGFDSLMRFYRFVVEQVDPETSIELAKA